MAVDISRCYLRVVDDRDRYSPVLPLLQGVSRFILRHTRIAYLDLKQFLRSCRSITQHRMTKDALTHMNLNFGGFVLSQCCVAKVNLDTVGW